MASGVWVIHDLAIQKIQNGEIDMDTDVMVMRLYVSGSNVNTSTVADASTATNELGTGNGYTQGGVSVTGSVTQSAGVTTVGLTDAVWTSSASGITARYAALIDTTVVPAEVVASCEMEVGLDTSVVAPNQLIVSCPTGLYTVSQV